MSHEEKRTPPKKPLVLVEWEDASNNSNYWDEDEKKKPLYKCHTVGFVMHRDHSKIVIASEGFDDGQFRHLHTIPKKMIVKIHLLKRVPIVLANQEPALNRAQRRHLLSS